MDFTFSQEQDAFRDSTRLVLDAMVADGRLRAMVDGDDDAITALWAQAGQLGWAAILVPEDAGGLGLGLVDAVVAIESSPVTGDRPTNPPVIRSARTIPADPRGEGPQPQSRPESPGPDR